MRRELREVIDKAKVINGKTLFTEMGDFFSNDEMVFTLPLYLDYREEVELALGSMLERAGYCPQCGNGSVVVKFVEHGQGQFDMLKKELFDIFDRDQKRKIVRGSVGI